MTPCIPAMRHTGTQSRNHHFFLVHYPLKLTVIRESLSPPLPSFPCVLCFVFYLRWIVTMWSKTSTPFPLKWKREWGNKKQFCANEKRKEKKGNACVSSPFSATLCPRLHKLWHLQKKKLQEQSLGPGDLRRDWPPPGALKRGSSGRHSGDLAPTVEDVRPGLGLTWVLVLACVCLCANNEGNEQAQKIHL